MVVVAVGWGGVHKWFQNCSKVMVLRRILSGEQWAHGSRISPVRVLKPKVHMCEGDKGWSLI